MRKVPPKPNCDRAIVVCALSVILLATLASSQAAVGVGMILQVRILGDRRWVRSGNHFQSTRRAADHTPVV